MKRFKSLSLKKKRTLAIAGISLAVLAVGGTIAYNQNSALFNNLFRLQSDVVEFTETFNSPEDWQPCQEIDKTAIATNKNATPRYVRMKINEYWRAKDTTTPITDHETTDLPLTWNDSGTDKHYAVINTQNDDKWELKNDGWYYYKTTLAQNESTLSLLKSVTFNCDASLAGETTYTDGGRVSESNPTEYAEANYHLYITFQMSDEEMGPKQHHADCDNPSILYDIIACQSQGPDDGVDFGLRASSTVDNYNGVNTISSSKNDEFPIHYFRGGVTNNYLDYNGFCWRLVRTAEKGGVKMIYAGVKGGNGCIDTSTSSSSDNVVWIGSGEYNSNWNETYLGRYELAHAGYMFDGEEKYYDVAGNFAGHFAGSDVTWNGTEYVLTDPVRFGNPYNTNGHNYVCFDPANPGNFDDHCEFVLYYISVVSGTNYGIRLVNGANWEDALAEMQTNTKSSTAKTAIDAWYDSNITSGRDHIEASVTYCNDRTGATAASAGSGVYIHAFGPYLRIRGDNGVSPKPSMDCRKNDAFSVDSTTGNGALTRPIAMLTTDEYMLAGFCFNGETSHSFPAAQRCRGASDGSNYLDSYYETWTMSPLSHDGNNTDMATAGNSTWIGYSSTGGSSSRYRPTLALKFDTEVEGTGTASDPYTIK
jgi:alternate signal-mediated exported protein